MKKYLLVALVATMINLPNTIFSQEVIGQVQHGGETFELVAVKIPELGIDTERNYFDLLKQAKMVNLIPIPRRVVFKINLDETALAPKVKNQPWTVFFGTEPFTGEEENKLYVKNGELREESIGTIDGSERYPLRWLEGRYATWIFLRAIHPKP